MHRALPAQLVSAIVVFGTELARAASDPKDGLFFEKHLYGNLSVGAGCS